MQPSWPKGSQPDPAELAAAADLAACRDLIRGGSRTFFAASLLLPRSVCEPAFALYAFCRVADDAIDEQDGRLDAHAWLRERLARAYEGRPFDIPADRAFAHVVSRFGVPRALPEALLEGFEWDARGRRYETLSEVYDYSARVAGTVGAMMAVLMGARESDAVARACDLGVAMQLSNIARDVGEDARAGRIYLPLQWLREAGVDPDAWLARPDFNPAIASVVRRLLQAADALYQRAESGIAALPRSCRPGIFAARYLYAEIGRQVERQGLDSVTARAVVPGHRKAMMLGRTLVAAARASAAAYAPPLAEVRFLVDAVAAAPAPWPMPLRAAAQVPARNFDERVGWLLDLFARLEREDQLERGAYPLQQQA